MATVASVNYWKMPDMGPAGLTAPNAPVLTTDTRDVQLKDVRGNEDKYNIDNVGFEYIKHHTDFNDWDNIGQIEAVYYEQIKQVIKDKFGAKQVYIDCHNRRGASSKVTIARAHIDRTPKSSRERLEEAVGPEEQERLNKANVPFLLLSCWRPIKTVKKDPLILTDKNTVNDDTDLQDMARPLAYGAQGAPGRLYWGKYNPNHQWYYMSEQTIEDLLFIKLADHREGHLPVGVLHSSAVLPNTEDLPARESIEVRIVATWE